MSFSQNNNSQQSKAMQQHALQWTNLTPFPYQRDVSKVAEALGLARRFSFLQDRAIFFRPSVRRRCPNGIMTERVVFVTPNGLLHLCDNDAAPKRTLALTELLSIVTDGVSQIALITDWPLVLRFEMPRNASSLPGAVQQIPTLKNFISLVKFFRPSASLLRCTPEDFSTVNLNLGKPRQFRAPASFDALLPPPDKSLDALLDEQQQRGGSGSPQGGDGMVGGNDLTAKNAANAIIKTMKQKLGNAAASRGGAGANASPQKRSVQFSSEPNRVVTGGGGGSTAPGSPMSPLSSDNGSTSAGSPRGGGRNNNNNNMSPSAAGDYHNRPEAPTGPTDFWAAQQNALFDQYASSSNFSGNNNNNSNMRSPSGGGGGGLRREASLGSNDGSENDLYYSKVPIDPKVDKVFVNNNDDNNNSSSSPSSSGKKNKKAQIVRFDREGNPLPETPQASAETTPSRGHQNNNSTSVGGGGGGRNVAEGGFEFGNDSITMPSAILSRNNNASSPEQQQQQARTPVISPSSFASRGLAKRQSLMMQQQEEEELEKQQQQMGAIPLGRQLEGANNSNNNNNNRYHQENYNYTPGNQSSDPFDSSYFEALPAKFEGKTGTEVTVGIDAVTRLEDENEFLRREVLELQLREKRMRNDPIPLGRVLPLEAAYAGAQIRNLGILLTSICKRRKLLAHMEMQMEAQQSVLRNASMLNSSEEDNNIMRDNNNNNQHQNDNNNSAAAAPPPSVPTLSSINPQSPTKNIMDDDI